MRIGVLGVSLNKPRRQGGHLLLFSHENRRKGGHLACLPYFFPRATTPYFFAKKRDFDTGFHPETPLLSNKLAKNRKFGKLFETKSVKIKVWQTF